MHHKLTLCSIHTHLKVEGGGGGGGERLENENFLRKV